MQKKILWRFTGGIEIINKQGYKHAWPNTKCVNYYLTSLGDISKIHLIDCFTNLMGIVFVFVFATSYAIYIYQPTHRSERLLLRNSLNGLSGKKNANNAPPQT